jgi:glycerophosphoryl diester phosphodiesterase
MKKEHGYLITDNEMTIKTIIIAHRGGAQLGEIENTIKAFQKSISLGIPMAELDVRRTKDQHLVCYHDELIDGKCLASLDYAELLQISRSKGFDIPLIEEILKICGKKIKLDVEIKEEGYEADLISLIKRYLNYSEFIIKSFNDKSVAKVKMLDPNIKTGLLLEGEYFNRLLSIRKISEIFPEYRILKTRVDFVSPHFDLLRLGFIWRMKLLKKDIYVWTVNEEEMLETLFRKNLDAVITDKPDLALKVIQRLDKHI